MSILKIAINPDPVLRKIAKEIDKKDFDTKWMKDFFVDMAETMINRDGIGLAAPQVSESIRLIVVNTKTGPMIMINPVIRKKSLIKEWDEEGCLSVPHTFGQVRRHKVIRVSFVDEVGQSRQIEARGLLARVIQHEIDHLDGILFIDKAKKITSDNYAM